ncbi:hypothetical protein BEH61_03015 [Clavibacter michiganensis subsp. insidiosus]|nr:hypothetical protein BEH61_03015 [Clavibacter michiganensis subsp. insidiosus]
MIFPMSVIPMTMAGVALSVMSVVAVIGVVHSGDRAPVYVSPSTVDARAATFDSPVAPTGTVMDKLTQYVGSTTTVPAQDLDQYLSAAHISDVTTSSGRALAPQRADVRRTEGGQFVLHVPFAEAPQQLDISGYTVFLDRDLRVISTGEVLFTALTPDSGRMQLWQNGVLGLDKVASNDSTAAVDADRSNITNADFNWDTLNQCLLNAGISQWVITIIGTGCALLCGATLGTGCVACIVGFAGVAGGTVGTCVGLAMS